MNYKTFDFLDLFIEAMEEGAEESLKDEAVENIHEIYSLHNKLEKMLRQYNKEIKILEGRLAKKKFLDSVSDVSDNLSESDFCSDEFSLAYRKNTGNSIESENADEDLKKIVLLKKIKDNSKKN